MYYSIFGQMKKQLGQMALWFDAAEKLSEEKSFKPEVLLAARLAPNQFELVRQIQIACDTAKLGASRLTGKEAPSHADDEKSIGELRERVASTVSFLDGLTEADFSSAATRTITQPRWNGKTMTGADYFLEHVTPNFFFHLSHAYAILRHNGVNLGKRDYLGTLSQAPAA